jgi:hypothetical protein
MSLLHVATQTPTQTHAQTQSQHNDSTDLIDRMDTLERKLDLILLKLDKSVIHNCDKMGTHIDFVNGVYDTVKVPLNYISKKIHNIMNPFGTTHKTLPLITANDDNNDNNNDDNDNNDTEQ